MTFCINQTFFPTEIFFFNTVYQLQFLYVFEFNFDLFNTNENNLFVLTLKCINQVMLKGT